MRATALDRAIAEARRFVQRAEEVRLSSDATHQMHFGNPHRDVAAMKRASLDLTRALADLRQDRE